MEVDVEIEIDELLLDELDMEIEDELLDELLLEILILELEEELLLDELVLILLVEIDDDDDELVEVEVVISCHVRPVGTVDGLLKESVIVEEKPECL